MKAFPSGGHVAEQGPKIRLFTACIILVSLAAYTPNINALGLYWDDWYLIYLGYHHGTDGLMTWIGGYRPFCGYNLAFMFWLLGPDPLPWQIATASLPLLGALALFWGLLRLWPERPGLALASALLLLIYPGYSYGPRSVVSWHLLLELPLTAFSFAATILAFQTRRWHWRLLLSLAAIIASTFSYMAYELYLGIEGLRALLFYYLLRVRQGQPRGQSLRKAGLLWSPYILAIFPYVFWRLLFSETSKEELSVSYRLGELTAHPLVSLLELTRDYYQAMVNTTVMSWAVPLKVRLETTDLTEGLWSLALGVAVAFALFFFLHHTEKVARQDAAKQETTPRERFLLGFLAVVLLLPWTGALDGTLTKYKLLILTAMGAMLLAGLLLMAWRRPHGSCRAFVTHLLSPLDHIWLGAGTAFLILLPYRYSNYPSSLFYPLLLASLGLAGALTWLTSHRARAARAAASSSTGGQGPGTEGNWSLWLGLAGVFLAMTVPVLTGRKVQLLSGWDRNTLPAILGIGLLYGAVIQGQAWPWLRRALLALLVGVGVAFHVCNNFYYAWGWSNQSDLWWQMSWRAPQLAHNVVLVAEIDQMPLTMQPYEVFAPASIIYNQIGISGYTLRPHLADKIKSGAQDTAGVNEFPIAVDFRNTLLISKPTGSCCLRVIDPTRGDLPASASPLLRSLASYSKPGLISTKGASPTPPLGIFGPEPPHGWCYFLQKAELAWQNDDWPEMLRLWSEAKQRGLTPREASECTPFLTAMLKLGSSDEARELASMAQGLVPPGGQTPPVLAGLIAQLNAPSAGGRPATAGGNRP